MKRCLLSFLVHRSRLNQCRVQAAEPELDAIVRGDTASSQMATGRWTSVAKELDETEVMVAGKTNKEKFEVKPSASFFPSFFFSRMIYLQNVTVTFLS